MLSHCGMVFLTSTFIWPVNPKGIKATLLKRRGTEGGERGVFFFGSHFHMKILSSISLYNSQVLPTAPWLFSRMLASMTEPPSGLFRSN